MGLTVGHLECDYPDCDGRIRDGDPAEADWTVTNNAEEVFCPIHDPAAEDRVSQDDSAGSYEDYDELGESGRLGGTA
jgi:hypothetical protein